MQGQLTDLVLLWHRTVVSGSIIVPSKREGSIKNWARHWPLDRLPHLCRQSGAKGDCRRTQGMTTVGIEWMVDTHLYLTASQRI